MDSNSNGKQGFLDRGTITALILVAAVWFGWSKWIESKYPTGKTAPATSAAATANNEKAAPAADSAGHTAAKSAADSAITEPTSKGSTTPSISGGAIPAPKEFNLEADGFKARLTSDGMALSHLEIKGYATRDDKPIVIAMGPVPMFGTGLVGHNERLAFDVSEESPGVWAGTAQTGGFKVEKRLELVKDGLAKGRTFRVTTKASGDLASFPGLRMAMSDEIAAPASSSFLAPSYDHHDWFIGHDDTKTRAVVDPKNPAAVDQKNVSAIALSSQYFTAALADKSGLRPEFHAPPVGASGEGFVSTGFVDYVPQTKGGEFIVEQILYVGPKDVDHLRAADESLSRVIDYGMFAIIAEPLLWLLRFFHSLFGNWGFAIIGLTIVVRALVLPFNIYSFKSMKVMQKLQPMIQAAKERHKDDPRRMNEEVMRLMRENKANPLGGCLPMLLQLPVFFALYQVLAQSIELYRAPFIFWISDLSIKDPYYVLPVLMGISMFVQQKITPVADPQQAKILVWMPVIFSFLMFTLPSGLTLYIFVSTIFGVTQQFVFMRDRSASAGSKTILEAKA